jgi:hypothetical protein
MAEPDRQELEAQVRTAKALAPKGVLWPGMSNRRRSRAIRALAKGQLTTNLAFESFITRGFWGRMLWLLLGR